MRPKSANSTMAIIKPPRSFLFSIVLLCARSSRVVRTQPSLSRSHGPAVRRYECLERDALRERRSANGAAAVADEGGDDLGEPRAQADGARRPRQLEGGDAGGEVAKRERTLRMVARLEDAVRRAVAGHRRRRRGGSEIACRHRRCADDQHRDRQRGCDLPLHPLKIRCVRHFRHAVCRRRRDVARQCRAETAPVALIDSASVPWLLDVKPAPGWMVTASFSACGRDVRWRPFEALPMQHGDHEIKRSEGRHT